MSEKRFFLRGKRQYILGADLLDFIIQQKNVEESKVRNIDFNIYKECISHPVIVAYSPELQADAVCKYTDSDSNLLLLSGTDRVTERVVDDEDEIQQLFQISGRDITIPVPTVEISFFRLTVIAFKSLLYKQNDISPTSKFLFARLTLAQIHTGPYFIRYSRLIGKQFYEGLITTSTEKLGAIYFALEQ